MEENFWGFEIKKAEILIEANRLVIICRTMMTQRPARNTQNTAAHSTRRGPPFNLFIIVKKAENHRDFLRFVHFVAVKKKVDRWRDNGPR